MNMSTLKQETVTKTRQTKKPLTTFWNTLLARQGIVAYMPIIAVNILMFYAASWQFLWLNIDPARYQCYALIYWIVSNIVKLLCAFIFSFFSFYFFHVSF